MEKAVQKLLVTEHQGIEFMRECKYHMEVRGVHHFRPALIHPDLFQDCLAIGAAAVAAGVLVELHMSAFGAFADVNAKPAGFTGEDGTGSFLVFIGLKMTGVTVILVRILPDLLDLKVTQGNHLRSGQKGTSHFWPGKKPDGYNKLPWRIYSFAEISARTTFHN